MLEASADELDRHRLALRIVRQNRMELIARSTEYLLARVDAAVGIADRKVLLHPGASPAVARSRNEIAAAVADFHARLGIENSWQSLDPRRWVDAAAEAKDRALATGAGGVDAARRLGVESLDRARSVTGKLPTRIPGRVLRRRGDDEEG